MAFGDFLPQGGGMLLPWRQRLALIVGGVLLVCLIACYVFEFWWMDNTIGVASLVVWSLVGGSLMGAALSWWLTRKLKDGFERFKMVLLGAFLLGAFGPLGGSLSNRLLAGPVQARRVQVQRIEAFAQSRLGFFKGEQVKPEGYYLFVYDSETQVLERLRFRSLPRPLPKRGQYIQVLVRRGFWGYDVVLPLDSQTAAQ